MHCSIRLTLGLLTATLVACGGSDNTTPAGTSTGEATTGGGATSSTGSTSTSTSPTTDGTTAGSISGTQGTTDLTTGVPDPTTGNPETSTSTGPVLTTDIGTTTDTGVETTGTTDTLDTLGTTLGTTTGLPSECPPAPNDDECALCNKENCCDEILACAESEDCTCILDCVMMGMNPQQCGMQCGVNPMNVPELGALRMCNMAECGDVCMP